jgi:hypothetical protein
MRSRTDPTGRNPLKAVQTRTPTAINGRPPRRASKRNHHTHFRVRHYALTPIAVRSRQNRSSKSIT